MQINLNSKHIDIEYIIQRRWEIEETRNNLYYEVLRITFFLKFGIRLGTANSVGNIFFTFFIESGPKEIIGLIGLEFSRIYP